MRYRRFLKAHGDGVLALVLAAIFALETWVNSKANGWSEIGSTGQALIVIAGFVLAGSINWRKRQPLAVLLIAIANLVVNFVVAPGFHDSMAGAIAILVGAYSAAAHTHRTASLFGLLLTISLVPLIELQDPRPDWSLSDLLFLSIIVMGPWLAGRAMRHHRAREQTLENLAEQLDRQQEIREKTAVAEERARIARELHDVVAHAITVMILQARGAMRALASSPEDTVNALRAIEGTGSLALVEMRHMLGLLAGEDASDTYAPQPSLSYVGDLVKQVTETGLPVDLVVEGDARPLSPGADLSAYRIIQEALTNSLKHAGDTTARVTIRYGGSAVELEVADDGVGPPAATEEGRGIVGMRERAILYGGQFETSTGDHGGFVVKARIPIKTGVV